MNRYKLKANLWRIKRKKALLGEWVFGENYFLDRLCIAYGLPVNCNERWNNRGITYSSKIHGRGDYPIAELLVASYYLTLRLLIWCLNYEKADSFS